MQLFDIPPGVLLDGLLVVLLVATISWCFILNRRLGNIRAASKQMKDLVSNFSTATEQAKAGIKALKVAAEVDGAALQDIVDTARVLRDELAFLTEAGDTLANRLADSRGAKVSSQQAASAYQTQEMPTVDTDQQSGIAEGPDDEAADISAALDMARAAAEEGEGPDSAAEQQLLQALRQVR
jgi:hypothetical protein